MLRELGSVKFPQERNLWVNMMPIVYGDDGTVPDWLSQYVPMIKACRFERGTTVYLSVRESWCDKGETQSRGGIHTEATCAMGWGGGNWGGAGGLYMASTDGACDVYDYQTTDVGVHGEILHAPKVTPRRMKANTLYWMTDRTPHEAKPCESSGVRQWFRLVSEDIGAWWREHSTPNPLGVQPKAYVLGGSKFT